MTRQRYLASTPTILRIPTTSGEANALTKTGSIGRLMMVMPNSLLRLTALMPIKKNLDQSSTALATRRALILEAFQTGDHQHRLKLALSIPHHSTTGTISMSSPRTNCLTAGQLRLERLQNGSKCPVAHHSCEFSTKTVMQFQSGDFSEVKKTALLKSHQFYKERRIPFHSNSTREVTKSKQS